MTDSTQDTRPPREPTEAMLAAVDAAHRPGWSIGWRKVWRTMYDAWIKESVSPVQSSHVHTRVCQAITDVMEAYREQPSPLPPSAAQAVIDAINAAKCRVLQWPPSPEVAVSLAYLMLDGARADLPPEELTKLRDYTTDELQAELQRRQFAGVTE